MARTWGTGALAGTGPQCTKRRFGDTDFCKNHGKQDPKCEPGVLKWEKHGRIDGPLPSFFPQADSDGDDSPKPPKAPKKKVTPKPEVVEKPVVVEKPQLKTPVVEEEVDEDAPFTPKAGMTLAEIEMDGEDFMWDEETGNLYDKAYFDEHGKLKKVGEYNDDEDDE